MDCMRGIEPVLTRVWSTWLFKDIVDVMVFSGEFHRDRYRKSERGMRQFGFTDFTEIEFAD